MPAVDIPVPEDLAELLEAPKCLDVKFPPPHDLKITLPSGGSIKALQDMSKAIPSDCALNFSLMLQLAPLLAAMECPLKILKLLKPISDVITNLPAPPGPALVKEVADAAADLAPCFLSITPAGMIPFVRDILCFILSVLRCLIQQMKTLAGIVGGLSIRLASAEEEGNQALIETLECAQENSMTALAHMMKGLEPVTALLDLLAPMMSIAGVEAIQLPALGDADSVEGIEETITTLEEVVASIQSVVDGLGGCPA
jgi:hypothetical protein